ncbi:hypothetical protein TRFO_40087 [Tritrichomonas foetus]|uniref:Uncharacterized protein n=1 Tax=Tritrichomonas foetus TaxID=1144522 RepID=A0A1J4J2B8_9EUKA|nr:hypothetical protein TRFO_40087 [Tritrichomonas foetus]|eukprot:OHS93614.1 hypothetical protein TRFO_40087 [Tritrichomonas foetus]
MKEENQQLKAQIKELEFQIRTKEAENNALQNQMQFFQQYMIGGAEGNDSSTTQTENPDNSTIPTNDNPPI